MPSIEMAFGAFRAASTLMTFRRGAVAAMRSGVNVGSHLFKLDLKDLSVRVSYGGNGVGMTVVGFVVAPAWELRERGGQPVFPTNGPELPARLEQNSEGTWKFEAREVAYQYYTWNKIFDEQRLPLRKRKFALKVRLGSGHYVTGMLTLPSLLSAVMRLVGDSQLQIDQVIAVLGLLASGYLFKQWRLGSLEAADRRALQMGGLPAQPGAYGQPYAQGYQPGVGQWNQGERPPLG